MSAASVVKGTEDDSVAHPQVQQIENDEGASLTPESEAEVLTTDRNGVEPEAFPELTDHETETSVKTQTLESMASLEIASPRPSPHIPSSNFMTARVEDCWDDDEPHAHNDYTPPSSFCVTTPPVNEALHHNPRASGMSIKPWLSEIHPQETKDEPRRLQTDPSDVPAQQNTSRRRPSVMDYLVSQGPVKYPTSTTEAGSPTSRRAAEGYVWPGHDRGPIHGRMGGQPNVFTGYHGDEKKSQIGWAAQKPSFRLVDNPLNVHDDHVPESSHRRGYSQSGEHNVPPPPSSSISAPHSDNRSEIYTGPSPANLDYANRLDGIAPTGYQQLATKLSGDTSGQPITPIYRRFSALHHRLLLYMQDEIADLERQLISLEAKDTVKRSYSGGVIPASRRQDRWINGSLADQKTEILGLIGYKLSQYSKVLHHDVAQMLFTNTGKDQVLASFCKAQDIPAPTWRDIHLYKTYLATSKLIIDDETRFLDASNDLVSLNAEFQPGDGFNMAGDGPTPMPNTAEEQSFTNFYKDNDKSPSTRADHGMSGRPNEAKFARLALSAMCVVFVPIVTFSVIPSFVGRMAIVLLIAVSVGIMVEQSDLLPEAEGHKMEWIMYSGLYLCAMATVAGAVR
ncbi:hypothetical protein QQS21_006868 [Conoideocrella luteorostrata]|uniref:DUF6594 domain-containing protein n=1 Tax=Conoideocrella luteorostrata TaxID=1105319 RepID=A0AAJ0FXJ9_9HYPO|nr:hypothetical protein QQS21_006868 [Conoideocrella luteorostrata]